MANIFRCHVPTTLAILVVFFVLVATAEELNTSSPTNGNMTGTWSNCKKKSCWTISIGTSLAVFGALLWFFRPASDITYADHILQEVKRSEVPSTIGHTKTLFFRIVIWGISLLLLQSAMLLVGWWRIRRQVCAMKDAKAKAMKQPTRPVYPVSKIQMPSELPAESRTTTTVGTSSWFKESHGHSLAAKANMSASSVHLKKC